MELLSKSFLYEQTSPTNHQLLCLQDILICSNVTSTYALCRVQNAKLDMHPPCDVHVQDLEAFKRSIQITLLSQLPLRMGQVPMTWTLQLSPGPSRTMPPWRQVATSR